MTRTASTPTQTEAGGLLRAIVADAAIQDTLIAQARLSLIEGDAGHHALSDQLLERVKGGLLLVYRQDLARSPRDMNQVEWDAAMRHIWLAAGESVADDERLLSDLECLVIH